MLQLCKIRNISCGNHKRESQQRCQALLHNHSMTADFWKTWGDGQAEVASYSLITTAAGESEKGTATMITAVEPFSKTLRVRAKPNAPTTPDVTQALRLSIIKKNSMVTTYVWLEPA